MTSALTTATVVPIGKSRKTTTHVSATASYTLGTTVSPTRMATELIMRKTQTKELENPSPFKSSF